MVHGHQTEKRELGIITDLNDADTLSCSVLFPNRKKHKLEAYVYFQQIFAIGKGVDSLLDHKGKVTKADEIVLAWWNQYGKGETDGKAYRTLVNAIVGIL